MDDSPYGRPDCGWHLVPAALHRPLESGGKFEELLVPGAIRSLADRTVSHPIKIVHRNQVINDPHNPYQREYTGDEDTRRKPAYHNGTAWTWLFPSFCEAWVQNYGAEGQAAALAWLSSGVRLLDSGCLGHIPEIMDGDAPHTAREIGRAHV